MTETFYETLGVDDDATTEEIEAAYRDRLKETHPDVSDDADAGRATRRLIEARDVLVDDEERARYDRLGHAAYVGTDTEEAAVSGDEDPDATSAWRDRARRERRASERVRREREGAQRDAETTASTPGDGSTTGRTDASPGRRGRSVTDPAADTAAGHSYSVREDVAATTRRGPLVPTGRELTLFGLFFPLYPVLLFSAVLPAFPLVVNLVLGACTLLTITYLQSMPRVALWLFGGWSALSVVGLALLGIAYFSAVGLVVLGGTVLPFGFSVLTAAALRY